MARSTFYDWRAGKYSISVRQLVKLTKVRGMRVRIVPS